MPIGEISWPFFANAAKALLRSRVGVENTLGYDAVNRCKRSNCDRVVDIAVTLLVPV